MAIIKAVSSRAKIEQAIDYVTKKEKTQEKLISGLYCEAETAKDEMQITKELWGKTGGRTYKHFVQSFAPEEKIDSETAHEIAKQLAEKIEAWNGHEILISTHIDREHVHTHFIVNSVNFLDGHKLQWSKKDLEKMKRINDKLCMERGLSIVKKGKTFAGKEREETSAYKKETYQLLKQAENKQAESYVQNIALAILTCKEKAINRQSFIKLMEQKGYKTNWKDNHKYITWTDMGREESGEKKCKIRDSRLQKYYNMDFGKEELEREFAYNARREQERNAAREQLDRVSRRAARADTRIGEAAAVELIHKLNAAEKSAEKERQNQVLKRKNRETERERCRTEESEREATRRRRETERSGRNTRISTEINFER